MHAFEYVDPREWKIVKEELLEIIHKVQDEVRADFTFQYRFIGSSSRKMITRDTGSNIGYDFDVNIEVNDPNEDYSPKEIRTILRNAFDRVNCPHGIIPRGYSFTEDSTRVLTIKVKDRANSRILHGCDFCIVYNCSDGRQQYIRYNKAQNSYSWEYQPKGYEKLPAKIDWIKQHGLWTQVRDLYLEKKNTNLDPHKRSRTLFAETIHEVWQKNQ